MGCRCQERREAIKRAAQSRSASEAAKAVKYVAKTSAQDVRQLLFRRKVQK